MYESPLLLSFEIEAGISGWCGGLGEAVAEFHWMNSRFFPLRPRL